MARVLITGAAGFIGMHTSIRFLKEGWDVVGLDNFNDYYSVSLKRDRVKEIRRSAIENRNTFTLFEADLNSDIWVKLHSYEFNAIIHLAAQAGVRYSIENPREYLESNILGFQSVLEFVVKIRPSRFLYASSSSVYGKNSAQPFSESAPCDSPESYYAATKRANELMAKSFFHTEGITSIGLRFFTVYGPWGRPDMAPILFAQAANKSGKIQVFNHGVQKRDFTYVDDIIEGIYRLTVSDKIPKSALICNIGSGNPIELMDFIGFIEKYSGQVLKKEFVKAQKGDVTETYADVALLKSLVQYSPSTNLEQGIKIFMNWYKSYY